MFEDVEPPAMFVVLSVTAAVWVRAPSNSSVTDVSTLSTFSWHRKLSGDFTLTVFLALARWSRRQFSMFNTCCTLPLKGNRWEQMKLREEEEDDDEDNWGKWDIPNRRFCCLLNKLTGKQLSCAWNHCESKRQQTHKTSSSHFMMEGEEAVTHPLWCIQSCVCRGY